MVDALVSGTSVQKTWRFESSPGHQIPPDKLKISLRNRGFPVGWDHFRDRF
jgi:hypothetical protein